MAIQLFNRATRIRTNPPISIVQLTHFETSMPRIDIDIRITPHLFVKYNRPSELTEEAKEKFREFTVLSNGLIRFGDLNPFMDRHTPRSITIEDDDISELDGIPWESFSSVILGVKKPFPCYSGFVTFNGGSEYQINHYAAPSGETDGDFIEFLIAQNIPFYESDDTASGDTAVMANVTNSSANDVMLSLRGCVLVKVTANQKAKGLLNYLHTPARKFADLHGFELPTHISW